MLIGGLVKHLRRSPTPDEDIYEALHWIKTLVDSIIIDPVESVTE